MAKLKPWYQVVTPREDLRENRPMDASEFAVHLDHIRERRQGVSQDYLDPARFFQRTYLTGSLLDLSAQVVRRLSGIQVETSAVFNMATQFGGGKTHSLTTLYHLATTGERAKAFKGVESILSRAGVPKVPKADVAVFVGTEFDVLQGRGGDGEPLRRTPWGEIAWQLGGEKAFAAVADHDAKGIAPAGDALRGMLPAGPALVLMDELLNYVSRARQAKQRDQFFAFLHNLSEECRARNDLVLCVSIPASTFTEMMPEDVADYEALKKLLDRLGKAIMMSADTEMAEVIRRRLFDWDGLSDDGRRAATAYADWAVEHSDELAGIDADTAHERFRAAYPFHPSLLSVFERKWQSLPRFQKTRGVLRLLALWVAHAYQEEHRKATRDPLITLGTAPFENPFFRSALFEQLGSSDLEVPVTTDIAGKADAHALRLDKEAPEDVRRERLHRKAAATIFFESNGGMAAAKAEATLPEIRLGVGGPDVNLAHLDNVLEALVGTCFYLNWNHNRYRFALSPNLNQILVTRRGAVPAKEIEDLIKKETQELFNRGPKELDRRPFPERSSDVPNRPALTLAYLSLDHPAGRKETDRLMETIVREYGGAGRTYKSAVIFAVPDPSESAREAAREALAWEAIDDDSETKERLDESQRQQLSRNLKRARSDLKESLFRAYRHLVLLDKDNKLRSIDLGQITSSMAPSLVDIYVNSLTSTDDVTKAVGAARLVKYWPPALTEWSTKGARDAFYSSPQLPRLLNADAIRRTIADGVTEGRLGYATKEGDRLTLLKFGESLSESEVEISDEFFVLRAEDAKKLQKPPRLASLSIHPGQVTLRPGEQASFSCAGQDQYGQPFRCEPTWSATGGTITDEGLFTAATGSPGGLFTVRAESGGVEATADVRINAAKKYDDEDDDKDKEEPAGLIRWQGEVPPQKWMNFYTKVLSRFGATSGLKLTVSFEAAADGEQGKAKAEEARSGLKELGLKDDVSVS